MVVIGVVFVALVVVVVSVVMVELFFLYKCTQYLLIETPESDDPVRFWI